MTEYGHQLEAGDVALKDDLSNASIATCKSYGVSYDRQGFLTGRGGSVGGSAFPDKDSTYWGGSTSNPSQDEYYKEEREYGREDWE